MVEPVSINSRKPRLSGAEQRRRAKEKNLQDGEIEIKFDLRFPKANLSLAREFEIFLDTNSYVGPRTVAAWLMAHEDVGLRILHDSYSIAIRAIYPKIETPDLYWMGGLNMYTQKLRELR